jgi:hypothetical protein
MTQLDDLAFCLMAAGGAEDPANRGVALLYVEATSLVSKLWTSGGAADFGDTMVISESVRPNSAASYVIGTSIRLVSYISTNNELRVSEYDEDSDEWVDDDTIPQYKVHPQGHVAAVLVPNDQIHIIFQDPSNRFNLLAKVDGSWTSTIIPVQPSPGSPIGTWTRGDQLHVFYVSANTDSLHYAIKGSGTWKDVAGTNCVFNDKSKPRRLIVMPDSTNANLFQMFVMSEKNTLWQFTEGAEKLTKLGNMEGDKFKPDQSEECVIVICTIM